MNVTIVSGTREKILGHLQNALRRIEEDNYYRISTVSPRGAATDLVFEVDPALTEGRDTHLIVQEIDGLMIGRPVVWVPGESMR